MITVKEIITQIEPLLSKYMTIGSFKISTAFIPKELNELKAICEHLKETVKVDEPLSDDALGRLLVIIAAHKPSLFTDPIFSLLKDILEITPFCTEVMQRLSRLKCDTATNLVNLYDYVDDIQYLAKTISKLDELSQDTLFKAIFKARQFENNLNHLTVIIKFERKLQQLTVIKQKNSLVFSNQYLSGTNCRVGNQNPFFPRTEKSIAALSQCLKIIDDESLYSQFLPNIDIRGNLAERMQTILQIDYDRQETIIVAAREYLSVLRDLKANHLFNFLDNIKDHSLDYGLGQFIEKIKTDHRIQELCVFLETFKATSPKDYEVKAKFINEILVGTMVKWIYGTHDSKNMPLTETILRLKIIADLDAQLYESLTSVLPPEVLNNPELLKSEITYDFPEDIKSAVRILELAKQWNYSNYSRLKQTQRPVYAALVMAIAPEIKAYHSSGAVFSERVYSVLISLIKNLSPEEHKAVVLLSDVIESQFKPIIKLLVDPHFSCQENYLLLVKTLLDAMVNQGLNLQHVLSVLNFLAINQKPNVDVINVINSLCIEQFYFDESGQFFNDNFTEDSYKQMLEYSLSLSITSVEEKSKKPFITFFETKEQSNCIDYSFFFKAAKKENTLPLISLDNDKEVPKKESYGEKAKDVHYKFM